MYMIVAGILSNVSSSSSSSLVIRYSVNHVENIIRDYKNKTPYKIICKLILMLFLKRVWLEGKTFFLM